MTCNMYLKMCLKLAVTDGYHTKYHGQIKCSITNINKLNFLNSKMLNYKESKFTETDFT